MKQFVVVTFVAFSAATGVAADKIERACKASDRNASASVCQCIQRVADTKLTNSDQRLAVKFFKDPQLAQDTRQSDDAHKESFWKRYKAFGFAAEKVCG